MSPLISSQPTAEVGLKHRKARIQLIASGDLVGKATKDAVQAAQAAVMICCIMPAVIAAAT